MDSRVEAVLAEYHERGTREERLFSELPAEEAMRRRDEFLLCVGPDTGALLGLLVKGCGARTILEIGTSYGYSTVWLAEAARQTGGTVITLELDARKVEYARDALRRAGLESQVDFRVGDALELLPRMSGPVDFVLLDLWKDLYVPCFDLFHPKLPEGAIVVADNMLEPEIARPAAEKYRAHLRATGRYDSVLLPVGSGVEVSRRIAR
ncbi:MAG: class I SAM-dependent methyltransferase [Pseudomonadota bacterium]|jgi:Predicted O-methyltransferase|nr:MAG: methyltransferase [Pseudomonadota bacterium]